jgi:RNA polymerase sigma-70 factor (ECF subfamily)
VTPAGARPTDGPTDEELMLRFCHGDERAFDRLFDRYSEAVHSFIARIVRDPEQTRDLLQVTFLSLVRSRLRFQRGKAVSPWLFTIAGNAARDALRREQHASQHAQWERFGPHALEPALPDTGLRKRLLRALSALSADQREAVLLRQLEGWSFREIARSAGITEMAARGRAHRGQVRLKALVERGLSTSDMGR